MSARGVNAHAGNYPGSSNDASSGHSPFEAKSAKKVTRSTESGVDGKSYSRNDYEDYYYSTKAQSPDDNADLLASLAFDEDSEDYDKYVTFQMGCGHIKWLMYNSKYKLLKVEFTKGARVVYSQVPEGVAGELVRLAKTKSGRVNGRKDRAATRKAMRTGGVVSFDERKVHDLGMKFWQLIRIKGKVHGSHYPFRYEKGNMSAVFKDNTKHRIVLSDKLLKNITGDTDIPENITLEMSISEDQLAALMQENEDNGSARYAMQSRSYRNKDGKVVTQEQVSLEEAREVGVDVISSIEDRLDKERALNSISVNIKDFGNKDYYDKLTAKINEAKKKYSEDIQNGLDEQYGFKALSAAAEKLGFTEDDMFGFYNAASHSYKDRNTNKIIDTVNYKEIIDSIRARAEMLGITDIDLSDVDYRYNSVVDKRFNEARLKKSIENAPLTKLVDAGLISADERNAYLGYNQAMQYRANSRNLLDLAMKTAKRVWSKQELIDFANPTIQGHISYGDKAEYDKYIRNEDWIGALSFLKKKDRLIKGVNNKTGKTTQIRVKYAGGNDIFAGE